MKYTHPDVLDNGLSHIASSAVSAILVPSYNASTTYSQVLNAALVTATITSADFTLADEGAGRKVVFTGKLAQAAKSAAASPTMHVVYTDGASRILWAQEEVSGIPIVSGQNYLLPSMTLIFTQPQN